MFMEHIVAIIAAPNSKDIKHFCNQFINKYNIAIRFKRHTSIASPTKRMKNITKRSYSNMLARKNAMGVFNTMLSPTTIQLLVARENKDSE